MPAQKTTQKKSSSRRKTAKPKMTAKKKSAAKPAAKKKSAAKPRTSKVKTVKKTSASKPIKVKVRKTSSGKKKDRLFVMSMNEAKKASSSKSKSIIPEIPVLDLDNLNGVKTETITVSHFNDLGQEAVHSHTRITFYLGVFFGAVVVNIFIVSLLALFSF